MRIGELAEASGVPVPTIKHYLREGLLPEPVKTSRNMAYYPPEFVDRIRLIKQLQEERFLPLKVIRSVLDEGPRAGAGPARARGPDPRPRPRRRARADEPGRGRERYDVPKEVLDRLEELEVLGPNSRGYSPSDIRIIEAISRFRAGGYDEQIGFTVYDTLRYKRAIEELVREEVAIVMERLAGEVSPERVVAMLEAGAEPLHDLIAALHTKAMVAELERHRAGRSWGGSGPKLGQTLLAADDRRVASSVRALVMSIVHSWVRSRREAGHRRLRPQGENLPGGLRDPRQRRRGPGREGAVGRLDSLGLEHRRDELAEHHRVAVGDEVGLAGRPFSAASSSPSTTLSTWVVSVRCRLRRSRRLPGLHRPHHLRQERRVALAPDESGAQDEGSNPGASRADRVLGAGLGRRVGRLRVRSQRRRLVDVTSGSPAISAASVPQWTKRRTPASRHAASAFSVPSTFPRSKSSRVPQSPRWAARWKAARSPRRRRSSTPGSERSPRTGSAPSAATASADASERASARNRAPRRPGARISRPPMKPEPPVTKAVEVTAADLSPGRSPAYSSLPCG